LVLIFCERKVLLTGWWLVLVRCERKSLLAGWLISQQNRKKYWYHFWILVEN